MKGKIQGLYVLLCVICLVFAAGCAENGEEVPTPEEETPAVTEVPEVAETPAVTEAGEISVEVMEAPELVEVGQNFSISWRVNSQVEMETPHTAIHYGPESQSGELTLQSYPFLTVPKNGTIPADFEDRLVLEEAGTTYFRAHAIVDGVNYWSEERSISVLDEETGAYGGAAEETGEGVQGEPVEVEVIDYPTGVESGETFSVRWNVIGGSPGDISTTSIISGSESGGESLEAYPAKSSPQGGTSPKEFETQMRAPITGDVYFRAYAVVDGTEFFSREYRVSVTGPSGY